MFSSAARSLGGYMARTYVRVAAQSRSPHGRRCLLMNVALIHEEVYLALTRTYPRRS